MSVGKKVVLWIALLLLAYGLSCPWQGAFTTVYLGFLPAPMFYLLLVHLGFVIFIAYLAFGTRMHGWVEDEEKFKDSLKDKEAAR